MGWEGRGLALVWDAAGEASHTLSVVVGENPLCPRGARAGGVRGPQSDLCSLPSPLCHPCLADPWAQVLHSRWDRGFLVIMKKCSTCKLMYILLKLYLMTTTVSIVLFFSPSPRKIFLLDTGNLGFNEFFLPKC